MRWEKMTKKEHFCVWGLAFKHIARYNNSMRPDYRTEAGVKTGNLKTEVTLSHPTFQNLFFTH